MTPLRVFIVCCFVLFVKAGNVDRVRSSYRYEDLLGDGGLGQAGKWKFKNEHTQGTSHPSENVQSGFRL